LAGHTYSKFCQILDYCTLKLHRTFFFLAEIPNPGILPADFPERQLSRRAGHAGTETQAQQQIHDENWALQQELQDLGHQVRRWYRALAFPFLNRYMRSCTSRARIADHISRFNMPGHCHMEILQGPKTSVPTGLRKGGTAL